mmetsp:Transcript_24424/g.35891  ORF Transcript_24424/g.35891 Transcript_24424/m.35891 type:complete len:351 (+) Transcript_24424:159-1211(+)|eukprot:CAMPEP_0185027406 /NCGR_PEP_ID=MMETSP1103-20130426/12428_1 /TAXON_ID=36769 /ORGANISM="Paraphysomonas bandaiensis, Strain Caron Lab Isolate" /LENGTH=350 /DNA_ID=CAMNT_0027561389 /DNA_START=91 /DNA_END=1143 /DNA_ORIENTATION=+
MDGINNWNGGSILGNSRKVSYEEATKDGTTRILFMGPRRSGKTSIDRVIFQNMSPHETLFLEATNSCDINNTLSNRLVQFQTWDFGGDLNLSTDVQYMGNDISFETIFKKSNTLVYVIDAQEDDYEDSLPKLAETISVAHNANPSIHFEVFLHKVDGDFMSEETKAERKQGIQSFVSAELSEKGNGDVLVSYYLTSIYDHSALEAFSKVVQKLVPQLPTLNSLLDVLIACCNIEKSFIVDVITKLYIATDSTPVDAHTYELCSDLLDVVVDISYIYGMTDGKTAYDDRSTSAIRLNNGMVLYLRQVSDYLALVCIMHVDSFSKRSLLDYNIDIFRGSLADLIGEEGNRRT